VRIVLIDYEDSFVHTLANYLRRTGADVSTLRAGFTADELRGALDRFRADAVVLSPGPGRPSDLDVSLAVRVATQRELPLFGVCLGLQGIVEHFGGTLGVLRQPMHGKQSEIRVLGGRLFEGVPRSFQAGRSHSLYADRATLPKPIRVTAETQDGVVMAIEHERLPIAAVQFHPESIMTLKEEVGFRIVQNVVRMFVATRHGAGVR
jgi:anthranilate synthase